jgi:hypothetical protein
MFLRVAREYYASFDAVAELRRGSTSRMALLCTTRDGQGGEDQRWSTELPPASASDVFSSYRPIGEVVLEVHGGELEPVEVLHWV